MGEAAPIEVLRAAPLEDRVLEHATTVEFFSATTVKEAFPYERDSNIYRAINKLARDGRIQYVKTYDRQKWYQGSGGSGLPHFRTSDGVPFPVSALLKSIINAEDPLYVAVPTGKLMWRPLLGSVVNKIPLLVSQLFVVAKMDDKKAALRQQHAVINELIAARKTLMTMLGYIDVVLNSPSVANLRVEDLRRVFANEEDSAMPSDEERVAFIKWVNENWGK